MNLRTGIAGLAFGLVCGPAAVAVQADTINFSVETRASGAPNDGRSGGLAGPFFVVAASKLDSPFFVISDAVALAAVNGWISVSVSTEGWEGPVEAVAQSIWSASFTNPEPEATAYDLKLSFGRGYLFLHQGQGNFPRRTPLKVGVVADIQVNGRTAYRAVTSIEKEPGTATIVLRGDVPREEILMDDGQGYEWPAFERHFVTDLIPPGGTVAIQYLMMASISGDHFGGDYAQTFFSDPLDLNGLPRTEPPPGLGFTLAPAGGGGVAVPEAGSGCCVITGLMGIRVWRRRRPA